MSSSRSASSVPMTVRIEVPRARRHQHGADRVAGARGQDVVARVADARERVRVDARAARAPSSSSSRCQRSLRTTVASAYRAIAPSSARSSERVDGRSGLGPAARPPDHAATASSDTARPSHESREPPRRGSSRGDRLAAGGGDRSGDRADDDTATCPSATVGDRDATRDPHRSAARPPPADRAADVVVIDGHGWGHGVGLSQYGAYGYALREGRDYRSSSATTTPAPRSGPRRRAHARAAQAHPRAADQRRHAGARRQRPPGAAGETRSTASRR